MYTDPTLADFKAYFFRDFPYGSTPDTVQDQDITNALSDAKVFLNPGIADTQEFYTLIFLLLAAHFMVMNLSASSQGAGGSFTWLSASKSVGSVSESYQIPQRILDNPEFALLSQTKYGAKYLMMILPSMSGQIFTICGGTQP